MNICVQNLADAFPAPTRFEQGIKISQYPDCLPVKMMLHKIIGQNKINRPRPKVFKQGLFAQVNDPVDLREIISPININEPFPGVVAAANIQLNEVFHVT